MFAENMIYISSVKATGWKEPNFVEKILRLLTRKWSANPDYDSVFPEVSEWLIEFGEDQMADREIGLNDKGIPVVAGPNERNYGFWLDTNMKLKDFENNLIEKTYFEEKWNEFHGKET